MVILVKSARKYAIRPYLSCIASAMCESDNENKGVLA